MAVGQGWQDELEVREPKPSGLATHRPELGTESAKESVAGSLEEETRMVSSDLMGQAVGDRTPADLHTPLFVP